MLQFTVSQQGAGRPYAFRATGIRVFSFEEALYHVYHYWRESADDFLSDELLAWAGDLGLTYITARMKELRRADSFADRMVGFLRLTPYFDDEEIVALQADLTQWEARREWEQLKERADKFLTRNDPAKAIPLYRRALQLDENVPLLNNLAVAQMRLGGHAEALRLLARARVLAPDNAALVLHYIEAAILDGAFEQALKGLEKARTLSADEADVVFLCGLMAYEQADYASALGLFEEALERNSTVAQYAYKMADAYLRMRQFDYALEALERVIDPDEEFYTKQAEIYAAYGNIPAAIRAIRTALEQAQTVNLWVRLAAYFRQDYDLDRANKAIGYALSMDAENDQARLENARIKKGLGKVREYQSGLNTVLHGFKQRYREE